LVDDLPDIRSLLPDRFWGYQWVLGMLILLVGSAVATSPAQAQQKIGYIDSEYILNKLPEYATVQQKLDRLEQQWRSDIDDARARVDTLQEEFQARELLYTEEERTAKREAIQEARGRVQELRQRYFGPDGELYSRQKELMRPIQERVLAAVEEVATAEGYDYVFDKSGDFLFMFARDQYDVSDAVLREMGVTLDRENRDEQASRSGNSRPDS
jgi:outer membrane protein